MKIQLAMACTLLFLTSCTSGKNFAPADKANEGTVETATPNGNEKSDDLTEEEVPIPKIQLALSDEELLGEALTGEDQLAALCARHPNKTNIVIQKFCVEKVRPKSLIELQQALGLAVVQEAPGRNNNGANGNPAFAFQGHSSSLVGRFTSAINPRVILMQAAAANNRTSSDSFVVMGFLRGEQFAEVIVKEAGVLEFFLVSFTQACNDKPEGCNAGDLLTPAIESNWTGFTIYEDEDIKNTIGDCRQCHQPEGVDSPKIMRMQELRNPWTHWFRDSTNGGPVLIADYQAAHGTDEVYGGVPGSMISGSDPQKLENMLRGNTVNGQAFDDLQIKEMEFQTGDIQDEINAANNAQPADNSVSGVSATWEALYQDAATGFAADGRTIIPIPYHDVKVTEPALLTKYTQQYQDYKAGVVTVDQFEDHREVLKLDPKERADMGFAVRPGTDVKTMLIQACNQCHNSKLDQSISRAKFNVDFDAMGDKAVEELYVAIDRLKLGYSLERLKSENIEFTTEDGQPVELHKGEHLLTMPPRRFKDLTDDQIDAIIDYMRQEQARLVAASAVK